MKKNILVKLLVLIVIVVSATGCYVEHRGYGYSYDRHYHHHRHHYDHGYYGYYGRY